MAVDKQFSKSYPDDQVVRLFIIYIFSLLLSSASFLDIFWYESHLAFQRHYQTMAGTGYSQLIYMNFIIITHCIVSSQNFGIFLISIVKLFQYELG